MKKIHIARVIKERKCIQEEIKTKFGEEAIKKARKRLCAKCATPTCIFLPLCSDGSDCPYFKLAPQLPLEK